MACFCHAQKHELYLGYNAVSYFDEHGLTPNTVDFSNYRFYGEIVRRAQHIPLIGYRFQLGKDQKLGLEYSNFGHRYVPISESTKVDSTLIGRTFSMVKLSFQKSFSFSRLQVSPQLSYSYRFNGLRDIFLYSMLPVRPEALYDSYLYRQHGLSTGIELNHPIFKGCHGLFGVTYTRFFALKDRNMLMLSYSIGYSFNVKKQVAEPDRK